MKYPIVNRKKVALLDLQAKTLIDLGRIELRYYGKMPRLFISCLQASLVAQRIVQAKNIIQSRPFITKPLASL